jgi:D-alanyl-D-alanine carboxypeptidase
MTGTPQDVLDYYQEWLSYRQWFLRIPGVQAAVAEDGQPRLSAAFGKADLQTGQPLGTGHLFRIASHSKTFTAVAVLQLMEQGRLRLDDTVASSVPQLATSPVANVTVRELLGHGAGVIRDSEDGDFWQLYRDFPDRTELERIVTEPSAAVLARNDRFKYSNIGFGVLGLIIEAVTGLGFTDSVNQTIITRLGLRDTGPELPLERQDDLAAGHSGLAYAAERRVIDHVATGALAAATGFYATAADLVRFYGALLPGNSELLSEDALRQLRHAQWQTKESEAYGLGLILNRLGDRQLLGHSGGFPGYITRTLACPDSKLVVAVLTNATDGPAEALATVLFRLLELAAAASHQPAGEQGSRFIGRLSSLFGVQDVALLDGRLFAFNPTTPNPAEDCFRLEVVDSSTLKIVDGPGSGSVGELMHYDFAADGSIRSVRGGSGMSMTPFEHPS